MKALILAAGLGTRLRPLTFENAKPSLPVAGVASLWFGAWHLKRELQVEEFMANVGHAPESLRRAAADRDLVAHTGIRFGFSDESAQILGSAGALWKLAPWIGRDTLAVFNGDSICLPSWRRMLEFHRKSGAAITLHVRRFAATDEQYTDLDVAENGRILGFGAKKNAGLMFSGAYLLEPELLSRLPAGVSELRPVLLEPLVREKRLFAYREDAEWIDCGTVRSYAEAQFDVVARIPQTRELVELKMKEQGQGCWIPKDWNAAGLKLTGPVVLTGDQRLWLQSLAASGGKGFGPRFAGIAPPVVATAIPTADALVFSSHIEKL